MFRRRRSRDDESPEVPDAASDSASELSLGEDADADDDDDGVPTDVDDIPEHERAKPERPDGPWDAAEVDLDDEEVRRGRLDLGALVVKGRASMQLRIDVDPKTRVVRSVTFMAEGAALQLQAFAAPRSTSLWPEVRREIAADCARRGGRSTEADGPYGPELLISLPVTTADGKPATQSSRIVGVDGPRWLLRASFLGAAIDPKRAESLAGVLRDVVVVRGGDPMAPRDMLPLRVPAGPDVGVAEPVDGTSEAASSERPALSPFRRGPEITELR